jgi:hypothetical protein
MATGEVTSEEPVDAIESTEITEEPWRKNGLGCKRMVIREAPQSLVKSQQFKQSKCVHHMFSPE